MFSENLVTLRKLHNMSQEELAERLNISRQTLSKYETGESVPDIGKCKQIASIFGVTLDDLVEYNSNEHLGFHVPPAGKHIFGLVEMGKNGEIVLPKKAREIFEIEEGDRLLVIGDEYRGIALLKEKSILDLLERSRQIKK